MLNLIVHKNIFRLFILGKLIELFMSILFLEPMTTCYLSTFYKNERDTKGYTLDKSSHKAELYCRPKRFPILKLIQCNLRKLLQAV